MKQVARQDSHSSFAVLPDSQFYACGYPEIFQAQGEWLANRAAERSIGITLHTGDVVDADTPEQWAVAAEALHQLDPVVTYLIAPGNHDLRTNRQTLLNDFFVPDDLFGEDQSSAGLQHEQHVENSYALVNLQGTPWLFLGLEFAPRDNVLSWANDVLAQHADTPAVLFTHAYLYSDGRRYDRAIQPLQLHHPDQYRVTPDQGVADGEDIWRDVVEPNENVKLVLSGHVIPDGVARSVARRASGSTVHQVLANFQLCGECPCEEVSGGNGYLRIFTLADNSSVFEVVTYSPYLDSYLRDSENEFVLSL